MVDNYPIQKDFHWESFRLSTISRPSPLESTFVINYEQRSTKMKALRLISRIHHNFFYHHMFHLNLVNLEKSELKKVFVLYKVIWIMNGYVVYNAAIYLVFILVFMERNNWHRERKESSSQTTFTRWGRIGGPKLSTFCQRSYHSKCKRWGEGGQKV